MHNINRNIIRWRICSSVRLKLLASSRIHRRRYQIPKLIVRVPRSISIIPTHTADPIGVPPSPDTRTKSKDYNNRNNRTDSNSNFQWVAPVRSNVGNTPIITGRRRARDRAWIRLHSPTSSRRRRIAASTRGRGCRRSSPDQ
jgi:hypothetical protein